MAPSTTACRSFCQHDAYAQWLDPTPLFPVDLNSLLVPYPADEMNAYPVSTLVNSPANDRPEVLAACLIDFFHHGIQRPFSCPRFA